MFNDKLKNIKIIAKELYTRFIEHEISYSAGRIAYFFILSVFPFLIFVNAIIASLNIPGDAAISFLEPLFPEQIVSFIALYLEYINGENALPLLSFGIVLSPFSASKAIRSLMHAFELAYGEQHRRRFFSQIIFSMLFIILSAVIFTFCVAVVALGNDFVSTLISDMPFNLAFIDLFSLWRWVTMALIMFITLSLVYKLIPSSKVKFSETLPGCIFALLSFLIFTAGFSFYVNNIASASVFYGTVGAVMLFMLWMYFAGIIITLGAELNKIVSDLKKR